MSYKTSLLKVCIVFSAIILFLVPHKLYADSEKLIEPEIVRLESVSVEPESKTIQVGNEKGAYTLFCVIGAKDASDAKYPDKPITWCTTPKPGTDYWVYNSETKWKLPGATKTTTLDFFEDFGVTYKGENIALVPTDNNSDWGIYSLIAWKKH